MNIQQLPINAISPAANNFGAEPCFIPTEMPTSETVTAISDSPGMPIPKFNTYSDQPTIVETPPIDDKKEKKKCPCDKSGSPGATHAENGCVDFGISFGRFPAVPSFKSGLLSITSTMLTMDIATPSGLHFEHITERRINSIELDGKNIGLDQDSGASVNVINEAGFPRMSYFRPGTSESSSAEGSLIHPEALRAVNEDGSPYNGAFKHVSRFEETLEDGTRLYYSRRDGRIDHMVTPEGITLTRAQIEDELKVIRFTPNGTGIVIGGDVADAPYGKRALSARIRQIWSKTDGLLDITGDYRIVNGYLRYTINWYSPDQVEPIQADNVFLTRPGAQPVKSWSVESYVVDVPGMSNGQPVTVQKLGKLTIIENRGSLSFINEWRQPDNGTLIFTRGSGADVEVCIKKISGTSGGFSGGTTTSVDGYSHRLDGQIVDQISETKYFFKGVQAGYNLDEAEYAIHEIYQRFKFGDAVVCKIEGYGSPDPIRTIYLYEVEPNLPYYGRMTKEIRDDGKEIHMTYDAIGRMLTRREPWAGGGFRITHYAWSNQRFNDRRIASETEYIEQDGELTQISRTAYTYEDGPVLRRETETTTAIGSPHTRTVTKEWYGGDPSQNGSSCPHAAGNLKLIRQADGTQTVYRYENTTEFGALYKVITELCVNGQPVSSRSTLGVEYINDKGNTVASRSYVHVGYRNSNAAQKPDLWYGTTAYKLVAHETYEHDHAHKIVKTTGYSGNEHTAEWICKGPLKEIDDNGIVTDYIYNSAKQLSESVRQAITSQIGIPETRVQYTYNATGRITKTARITDNLELVMESRYDKGGRITSQTDESGLITQYGYADKGLTRTVTTPAGAEMVTRTHPDGSILSETGNGQQARYYTYGLAAEGLFTQIRVDTIDGPLVSETITDGLGRTLIHRTAGGDGTMLEERNTYNNRGLLAQVDRTGQPSRFYEYDTLGIVNRSYQKNVSGTTPSAAFNIDTFSRLYMDDFMYHTPVSWTTLDEARVDKTLFTFLCTTITDATRWKKSEQVSSLTPRFPVMNATNDSTDRETLDYTDRNGCVVTEGSRLFHIEHSNHTKQTSVYGEPVSETNAAGATTWYDTYWTPDGRSVRQRDPRNNETWTEYNKAELPTAMFDETNAATYYEYHPQTGLLATQTYPDNSIARYTYDSRGLKTSEYGTAVQPVCYSYDNAGRLVSMTTFRSSGDDNADPSGRTDGDTTTWGYQPATGLLTRKQYADGTADTFQYNNLGQLMREIKASGRQTDYTYDWDTGKIATIAHGMAGQPQNHEQTTHRYDKRGRLVETWDIAGNHTWLYNSSGQLTTETHTGFHNTRTTYQWDYRGFYTGYQLWYEGRTIQTMDLGYDRIGRISTVVLNGKNRFTYGYHPLTGHQQTLTYPNGIVKTVTLENNRDLPATINYQDQTGSKNIMTQHMQWNNMHRLFAEQRQIHGAISNEREYTYNSRGELVRLEQPGPLVEWDYDQAGNRLTSSREWANTYTYTANALNQVTAIQDQSGSFIPSYDSDGNQTRIRTASGIWNTSWGLDGKPTEIRNISNGRTVQYSHDSSGRKFISIEPSRQNNWTQYHYIGDQIVAMTGANTMELLYTFLWDPTQPQATRPLAIITWDTNLPDGSMQDYPNVMDMNYPVSIFETDEPGNNHGGTASGSGSGDSGSDSNSGLGSGDSGSDSDSGSGSDGSGGSSLPFWMTRMTGKHYYLHDHNKNVAALTDTRGEVSAWYDYDPFGEVLSQGGPISHQNPFRFSSEFCNSETGLIEYLLRQYNPQNGRWTSRDPIAEAGGLNLYSFIGNDTMNFIDILGLQQGTFVGKRTHKIVKSESDKGCSITLTVNIELTFHKKNVDKKKIIQNMKDTAYNLYNRKGKNGKENHFKVDNCCTLKFDINPYEAPAKGIHLSLPRGYDQKKNKISLTEGVLSHVNTHATASSDGRWDINDSNEVFAHEIGHLLGAEDHYPNPFTRAKLIEDPKIKEKYPDFYKKENLKKNLMNDQENNPEVHPQSIDEIIAANEIKCNPQK